MQIFVPSETSPGETRIPLLPDTASRLSRKGLEVIVEAGSGDGCGFRDSDYTSAGASIAANRLEALASADMVLRLHKPPEAEVGVMKTGAVHISFLDPFAETGLVDALAQARVTALSMELIPRTTLAQKMDALSSQANLAGYVAVILGAARLPLAMPMMMTPAGTLKPARVFVIGAGVAGLQAIATARRLGARVEAFDTRPVVEEQVHSLGARFVKVDLGETGQTRDGYAMELTSEQQARQREVPEGLGGTQAALLICLEQRYRAAKTYRSDLINSLSAVDLDVYAQSLSEDLKELMYSDGTYRFYKRAVTEKLEEGSAGDTAPLADSIWLAMVRFQIRS